MYYQPIKSCVRFLGKIASRPAPSGPPKRKQPRLIPSFALLQFPATTLADGQFTNDSALVVTLVILAGLLGLSAALLYRHMHGAEEKTRLRAENAEAELQALLTLTDDAVLIIAPDGTVRATNPASEEVFGRPTEEFIGEPLSEIIAQPLSLGQLTKHGPVNFETTAKRPNGAFARVEMLLSPIEIGGRTTYLAVVHDARASFPVPGENDATPASSLIQPIERLTHDMNNQLTSVIGNLSLALMSAPSDPANYERILNAKRTAIRAHMLNQNLQSLASEPHEAPPELAAAPAGARTIVPLPDFNRTPQSDTGTAPSHKPRILILDDEEMICELVALALQSMGHEVTKATSVETAIHACEEAVKAGKPYDVVISDLSLPGDVSGDQAVARMHTIDPHIKAIASSGHSSDPIMRDCRRHGFAAAIPKPYEISKLGRIVSEVIRGGADETRKSA